MGHRAQAADEWTAQCAHRRVVAPRLAHPAVAEGRNRVHDEMPLGLPTPYSLLPTP
ncbi:MAG: hypothetical protein F6K24_22620 [Okeania sp. SIO2D1]|nr:hypothetical protein [Okeania sp. SIO2D1]